MTDNENLNRMKAPAAKDMRRSAFYRSRRLVLESRLREKKRHKEKKTVETAVQQNMPTV